MREGALRIALDQEGFAAVLAPTQAWGVWLRNAFRVFLEHRGTQACSFRSKWLGPANQVRSSQNRAIRRCLFCRVSQLQDNARRSCGDELCDAICDVRLVLARESVNLLTFLHTGAVVYIQLSLAFNRQLWLSAASCWTIFLGCALLNVCIALPKILRSFATPRFLLNSWFIAIIALGVSHLLPSHTSSQDIFYMSMILLVFRPSNDFHVHAHFFPSSRQLTLSLRCGCEAHRGQHCLVGGGIHFQFHSAA